MKPEERTFIPALLLACLLALAGLHLGARPARAAEPDDAAAIPSPALAEDTNTVAESTNVQTTESDEGDAGSPIVVIGKDAELKAGQTAEAVVVIGGNAKIHGHVREAVVAVGGDVEVDGEVGDAVVAVLGNVDAKTGAKIHGDAVAVGGRVDVAPGAHVSRTQQGVEFPNMRWARNWFVHCALLLRPLSFHVGWAWMVAGAVFLFYLLIAAIFPKPVEVCAGELLRRPATSFLVGLLTILLLPFLILLLAVTGVGLIAVPFVIAAVFIATIVGKVSLLEWIGFKIGRQSGTEKLEKPLLALIIGTIVILLLYLVPVVGLATFALTRVWGLGAAVLAGLSGLRREIPEKQTPPSAPSPAPEPQSTTPAVPESTLALAAVPGSPENIGPAPVPAAPANPAEAPKPEPPPQPPSPPVTPTPPSLAPSVPELLAHPHAGFWERMGAGFLDVVLICVMAAWVGPFAPVVALAYFTGMWAWKQTSIGGIVLGLKVVRVDGGQMTFTVALVRSLAAGFSIFVLFLGFLWIAWDKEKQGWHDKIAGTAVLKLPRGTPLVCL